MTSRSVVVNPLFIATQFAPLSTLLNIPASVAANIVFEFEGLKARAFTSRADNPASLGAKFAAPSTLLYTFTVRDIFDIPAKTTFVFFGSTKISLTGSLGNPLALKVQVAPPLTLL